MKNDKSLEEIAKIEKDKKLRHYIDNEKLYKEMAVYSAEMKIYKEKCQNNEEYPRPRMSEYIGTSILLIAERLSSRPNFCGYTYKDEMISDGVENCLVYAHNFNPEISKNAFAYITQIIYYAFLRRISREKEQFYTKMCLVRDSDIDGKFRNRLIKNYAEQGEYLDTQEVYLKHFNLKKLDVDNIEKKTSTKTSKAAKKSKPIKKSKKNLDDLMN